MLSFHLSNSIFVGFIIVPAICMFIGFYSLDVTAFNTCMMYYMYMYMYMKGLMISLHVYCCLPCRGALAMESE